MTPPNDYTSSPSRSLVRRMLRALSIPAFALLTDLRKSPVRENLPPGGPLLVVGNHFSFIDPVCFVRLAPWPIEFLGGAHMPHAPGWARLIPLLWLSSALSRHGSDRFAQNGGGDFEARRHSGGLPRSRRLSFGAAPGAARHRVDCHPRAGRFCRSAWSGCMRSSLARA